MQPVRCICSPTCHFARVERLLNVKDLHKQVGGGPEEVTQGHGLSCTSCLLFFWVLNSSLLWYPADSEALKVVQLLVFHTTLRTRTTLAWQTYKELHLVAAPIADACLVQSGKERLRANPGQEQIRKWNCSNVLVESRVSPLGPLSLPSY